MDNASTVPATTATLIDEYGDVLPPSFIASTVEAAAAGRQPAQTARDDVAAAAEAALRAAVAASTRDPAGEGG